MRRTAWVMFLAILALPAVAAAQSDTNLENMPELAIAIEKPSPDRFKCGITESALDAAVRIPLDNSRVRVARDKSFSVLVVSVSPIEVGAGCASSLSLFVYRGVTVDETGKQALAAVWMRMGTIGGAAHDFAQRVNSKVREYTEEFLAEWIKQNPKPEAPPSS